MQNNKINLYLIKSMVVLILPVCFSAASLSQDITLKPLVDIFSLPPAPPEEDINLFKEEIACHAFDLFPGYASSAKDFFKDIAVKLPKERRSKYLDLMETFNISQYGFINACRNKTIGSSRKLYTAFLVFAIYKNHEIKERLTINDLVNLKISYGQPYSISEEELDIFVEEIIRNAALLFPTQTKRSKDLFIDFSKFLPDDKVEEYLTRINLLKLSQDAFDVGRRQLRSADKIHQAFLIFAEYKEHTIQGRVKIDDLKKMGLIFGAELKEAGFISSTEYSISDEDLKKFETEVISITTTIFPGYKTKTNDFFTKLASLLPEDRQKDYLTRLKLLSLGQNAFSNAMFGNAHGSARKIHKAFLIFAHLSGVKVENRITLQNLVELGLVDENTLSSIQCKRHITETKMPL